MLTVSKRASRWPLRPWATMSLASFVPSLLLFLGSSIAVTLAAAIASLITFVMAFFSTGPSKPQGSSNGLGSGKNLGKDPKNIFGIYFFRDLQKSYDDFFFGP